MARALKVYSVRDNHVYLPPDVIEALSVRSHVHAGDALIWATTAKAACEHFAATGLPTGLRPKDLQVCSPVYRADVKALRDWPDGTVLVMAGYSGKVVEIARNPSVDGYTTHLVGEYVYMNYNAFIPSTDYAPNAVTDGMVSAAQVTALSAGYQYIHADSVRVIIETALRVQVEEKAQAIRVR